MNAAEVTKYFEQNYPGKDVIKLPPDDPTEIICETEPTSEHPDYSVAMAAIKKSALHHHIKTSETYHILKGTLTLVVEGEEIQLKPGDVYEVKPPAKHYAVGDFTLARVLSNPGWTPNDHILDTD